MTCDQREPQTRSGSPPLTPSQPKSGLADFGRSKVSARRAQKIGLQRRRHGRGSSARASHRIGHFASPSVYRVQDALKSEPLGGPELWPRCAKRHDHVLRDIREYQQILEPNLVRGFAEHCRPSSYRAADGKEALAISTTLLDQRRESVHRPIQRVHLISDLAHRRRSNSPCLCTTGIGHVCTAASVRRSQVSFFVPLVGA